MLPLFFMNCGGTKYIEILPSKANRSKLFANMDMVTLSGSPHQITCPISV